MKIKKAIRLILLFIVILLCLGIGESVCAETVSVSSINGKTIWTVPIKEDIDNGKEIDKKLAEIINKITGLTADQIKEGLQETNNPLNYDVGFKTRTSRGFW